MRRCALDTSRTRADRGAAESDNGRQERRSLRVGLDDRFGSWVLSVTTETELSTTRRSERPAERTNPNLPTAQCVYVLRRHATSPGTSRIQPSRSSSWSRASTASGSFRADCQAEVQHWSGGRCAGRRSLRGMTGQAGMIESWPTPSGTP